ncbi:MAG: PAS domain-containing protein [Syntrophorhabdaceae bacterium]
MDLKSLLHVHRDEIIAEWVHRLHTDVSAHYSSRPVDELKMTITEATDANFEVLVANDFSKMDEFIEKITRMRLGVGFSLSEIQGAFELYQTILIPLLVNELDPPSLLDTLQKLNNCLSRTIRKFSDYFESLHQKVILEHAQDLERIVEERTAELTESEAKYRMLVEDINDGYFVIHRGHIVFANRAFCDMHGYSPEEVLGRPYMDFVAAESRDKLARVYEERKVTGEAPDQYIFLRLYKDGKTAYSENKVKVVMYEGNVATAGICRDITERMEVEKHKLRVIELENERKTIALTTLQQLMVTLSHYLLNANTVIGGMVRRSLRTRSDEERLSALEAIRRQAIKTEGIIEALKKVTEIKTTGYTYESQVLMMDLTKEIEKILADIDKRSQA